MDGSEGKDKQKGKSAFRGEKERVEATINVVRMLERPTKQSSSSTAQSD